MCTPIIGLVRVGVICENNHFLPLFPFTIQVSNEVELFTILKEVWKGNAIEERLRNWCENTNVKSYKASIIIISCGMWLFKNANLFR